MFSNSLDYLYPFTPNTKIVEIKTTMNSPNQPPRGWCTFDNDGEETVFYISEHADVFINEVQRYVVRDEQMISRRSM